MKAPISLWGDRRSRPSADSMRGQASQAARIVEMMMGIRPDRSEDFMPAPPLALRLGLSSSLSCGRARQAVKDFVAAAPDMELLVSALPSDDVARRVKQGGLDIGLVCHKTQPQGCRSETLWCEALFVVLPETHRLARDNAVSPDDLRGETLLSTRRDLPGVQEWLADTAAWPLMAPQPLEVDRETLFNLVALGFGVALASGSALGVYYPGVVYRPLRGCEEAAPYRALWRERDVHPGLERFLEAARAAARRPEARR